MEFEKFSTLSVGGRLLIVIVLMPPACRLPAECGVYPVVGRTSVWNNSEILRWCSNFKLDEVLSVICVLDWNFLDSEEHGLNGLNFTLEHFRGEFLLHHWDSSSLSGSDESGNSDLFLHI